MARFALSKIVEHRGDKVDDGIIRIEYRFEKFKQVNINYVTTYTPFPRYTPWTFYSDHICSNEVVGSSPTQYGGTGSSCLNSNESFLREEIGPSKVYKSSRIKSEEGITVKGSQSNQVFNYAHVEELEENSFTIVLRLKGYVGYKEVKKPFLTQDKLICASCGTKSNTNIKFCPECGTFLRN